MAIDVSDDVIRSELRRLGVPHEDIAKAINRDRTAATKLMSGTRSIKGNEVASLLDLIEAYSNRHTHNSPDLPAPHDEADYIEINVLPTYAGMGGGGTGDGDGTKALISRQLVERELRAKPDDLLVINVRGDSMEPLFFHDDQLLIDCRDTNPVQPGPFALWDGDGFVVKNVERNPKTKMLRVFSSNPTYSPHEFGPDDDLKIMGRPVWFARRL